MSDDVVLAGLDGSNPLAFLAAMGALQTLSDVWRDRGVALGWRVEGGWRPYLRLSIPATPDQVVEALSAALSSDGAARPFEIADDLKLSAAEFRRWALEAVEAATASSRRWCDFVAAFGCEGVVNDGVVADTAFRTMSGAGHQHFLATMRELVATTTAEHLRKALFEPWQYDDPLEGRTMRWDPIDDRRYAFRWGNPALDRTKGRRGAVQGANRLAIEGLRVFPTAPVSGRLATTGFTGQRSTDTCWTWPIWSGALSVDVVRSLLARAELQGRAGVTASLRGCGVEAVFRSRRLTVGKLRSFAPAEAL